LTGPAAAWSFKRFSFVRFSIDLESGQSWNTGTCNQALKRIQSIGAWCLKSGLI